MSAVSTFLQTLMDSMTIPDTKHCKKKTTLAAALIQTHEWIKVEVALHIVDISKGVNVFPHTTSDFQYISLISTAIEIFMNMTSSE